MGLEIQSVPLGTRLLLSFVVIFKLKGKLAFSNRKPGRKVAPGLLRSKTFQKFRGLAVE